MSIESVTGAAEAQRSLASDGLVDLGAFHRLENIEDPRVRAEAVASQLESVFYGMMMKAMRDTVPEGGLLGEGLGGKNYVEMLDQHLMQLGGLPRDPRFHESLVQQIMDRPASADAALGRLQGSEKS